MNRRDFMKGVLAASMAPAIVKAENIMWINPRILTPKLITPLFGGYIAFIDGKNRILATVPADLQSPAWDYENLGLIADVRVPPEGSVVHGTGTIKRAVLHHHLVPGGSQPLQLNIDNPQVITRQSIAVHINPARIKYGQPI